MDLIALDTATRPQRPKPRRAAEAKAAPRARDAAAPTSKTVPPAAPDGHEHPLATAHF